VDFVGGGAEGGFGRDGRRFFRQCAGGADGAVMMQFLVDAPDLPESGGKDTVR